MEIASIIAVVVFVAVVVAGVLLKLFTRGKLRDMDGCGEVTKASKNKTIARF